MKKLEEKIDESYPWDKTTVGYKELTDRRRFMGVYVSASGHVFRKNGTQIKPTPVFQTRKDGSRKLNTFTIEYTLDGERVSRTYQRFVYAAFNEDFDIEDSGTVVVSKTDNPFEMRVKYLEAIPRKEHFRRVGDGNKKFNDEEREKIANTFWEVEGIITKKDFAKEIGTSEVTLNKILEEYPYGRLKK